MKKEHDCEIPFSLPTMNLPFNSPFIFSQHISSFGLGLSVGENPESSVGFPGEMAAMSQPLDELSALIQKYNVMGLGNPFVSMETSRVRISGVTSDSNKKEDGVHPYCNEKKRRRRLESACRRSHSFCERQRRSDMNRLFEQIHSLLPNPTVKRSKACIVSDIVDYIQSLQNQLALHSSQNGGPKLPVKTGSRCARLKNESIPEMEAPSSGCGRSDSMPSSNSKSVNPNLNVIYNGKDIFITMKCVNNVNALTSLICAVESHNIQVINGFVSTTDTVAFHSLHAKVTDILTPEAKETLHGNLKKLMKSEFKISLKSE